MNRSTTFAGIAVALLATGAMFASIANATINSDTQQITTETVKFADLDLNRPADSKVLLQRIRVAAHNVCSYNGYIAQPTCYRKAVREAVQKVNRPQLTAAL